MSTIVTRAGKGSALTHTEVDANFTNLNADKIEAAQSVTLTNKTISGSNNTLSNIGNSSLTNSSVTIGSTNVSLGGTAATVSGLTLTSPTVNTATISGGTINNAAIGGTTPAAGSFTSLTDSGNLTFTGTGNRITGDFSNATVANRMAFQTSTTNSATSVYILPNGTSPTSQFVAVNNSDPTNASVLQLQVNATDYQIRGGITGTGTYLPMTFYTGGAERARIATNGDFSFNSGYGSVATAYGCRAWVNFNGTGTVAIRASGNVSSITDNGTGNYTVNFTTALADANYAVSTGGCYLDNNAVERNFGVTTESFTTSSVKILSADMTTGSALDVAVVSASIFR